MSKVAATSRQIPKGWPKDRPLAVSVSVMLEGWTDDSAPGLGPMGNPLKAGVLDSQARSWADYGPKTGAWHLLDAFEQCGIKAVFYVSGILADRYPELMKAIAAQGHAIGAHAWAQNILPAYQTREEEETDLKRTVAALERHSGQKPQGWISPRATPSVNTPDLLARHGLHWYADAFDQDLPYLTQTPSGPVVAVPFTVEVNDVPLHIKHGNEPDAFVRVLDRILLGWKDFGKPACLDITAHAHVFGRPPGVMMMKEAIRRAQRADSAWLTTHAELAALCLKA